VKGATLRTISEGKNGTVYINGYRFNKLVYNASVLGSDPDYQKKIERLMGTADLAKQFLGLTKANLVNPPKEPEVVDTSSGNDPSVNGPIAKPNSGGTNDQTGARPGYSNNLYEYLKKLKPSLEARSVLEQQKTFFGKDDLKPPNTEILHRPAPKTFVQNYGLIVLGVVAGGFGAAYYGKHRTDFISEDTERENIKAREDIRRITQASLLAERNALHDYQVGGLGTEVAQSTRAATNDAIHILENEAGIKNGMNLPEHTEFAETAKKTNIIDTVPGTSEATKSPQGSLAPNVSRNINPMGYRGSQAINAVNNDESIVDYTKRRVKNEISDSVVRAVGASLDRELGTSKVPQSEQETLLNNSVKNDELALDLKKEELELKEASITTDPEDIQEIKDEIKEDSQKLEVEKNLLDFNTPAPQYESAQVNTY